MPDELAQIQRMSLGSQGGLTPEQWGQWFGRIDRFVRRGGAAAAQDIGARTGFLDPAAMRQRMVPVHAGALEMWEQAERENIERQNAARMLEAQRKMAEAGKWQGLGAGFGALIGGGFGAGGGQLGAALGSAIGGLF